MGNYPLEQITKPRGEFSTIVKFIQSPSDVLGIFSRSLNHALLQTQITGGGP